MIRIDPATGNEVLASIPSWLEGECLYGLCARIDDVHGFRKEDTSIALFGKPRAYRSRSLPSGLSRFASVTKGLLGSPETILRERTSAAAYLPFLPAEHRRRVLSAATATDSPAVFQILGLTGSGLGSQCELRHCIECHREGLDSTGESIRLLDHQLPASWYCEKHARVLHVQPHRGIGYALPDDGEGLIYPSQRLPEPRDRRERQALALCGALAKRITTLPKIDVDALVLDCLHRLEDIGVCSGKRLNIAALDQWFSACPIGQWLARAGTQRLPAGWIAKLLRSRLSPNPLTWILLWCAIWDDVGQDKALEAFECIATGERSKYRPTPYELPMLEAQSWTSFPTAKHVVDAHLAQRLAHGASIGDLAAETGRPAEEIERIFFASPKIRERALRSQRRAHFEEARDKISLFLMNRPFATVAELERALPDAVSFVVTHRREYWRKVVEHLSAGPTTAWKLL